MNLSTMTQEALTELYDKYIPQFDNTYKVEIFPNGNNHSIGNINLDNYICFHTTKVSFNGESLSLERDPVTKQFKLQNTNSFNRTNTLSLTWRECNGWEVKRYHDAWIGLIYDRNNDRYHSFPIDKNNNKTAQKVLYRNIRVTFPCQTSFSSKDKEAYIEFMDVLPNTSGSIELGYNTTSNIVSHTINYYVTDWSFSSNNEQEVISQEPSVSLNPQEERSNISAHQAYQWYQRMMYNREQIRQKYGI